MKLNTNSILRPETIKTCKIESLDSKQLVFRGMEESARRKNAALFRKESAKEFVGELYPGMHIFGLTKGQFSMVDLIEAISLQLGPHEFCLSTWTAIHSDITRIEAINEQIGFTRTRFIFDFSFQRRQPGMLKALRDRFGTESIRIMHTHSKFILFKCDNWRLVVRTSMNLNMNPRMEDIDIADDPVLYAFLEKIIDRIFGKLNPNEQKTQKIREHRKDFESL